MQTSFQPARPGDYVKCYSKLWLELHRGSLRPVPDVCAEMSHASVTDATKCFDNLFSCSLYSLCASEVKTLRRYINSIIIIIITIIIIMVCC